MYELIDDENDTSIDNEEYLHIYELIFADVIRKCDFKKWHDALRILNNTPSATPSPKALQTQTFALLKQCLHSMFENQTENCSVYKENIYIEIYGLNYPDPEKQGLVNVSLRIENFYSRMPDVIEFETTNLEEHLTHEERLQSLENRIRTLEKKIGIT